MQFLGAEHNFLGIDQTEFHSYDASDVVIQSFPYEHSSSYHQGSIDGPSAIIKSSKYVELYDEELDMESYLKCGICTLAEWDLDDKVNEDAMDFIYDKTLQLLNSGKFVVSLGAEHTVTFGIVKAFLEKFEDLCILQIDAHSDLRMEYEGNPWSHASVMARCLELKIAGITQIGIRAQSKEEANTIKTNPKVNTIYAHERAKIHSKDYLNHLSKNVYITIDADGFDPSVMPAVGTPEPNGLLWEETLEILRNVSMHRNIVGFDVVECAPRTIDTLTEYNLAKLIYKLIGLKYYQW